MSGTGTPAGGPGRRAWSALRLELPERLVEALLAELAAGCLGLQSQPIDGERERATFYFDRPEQAEAAQRVAARLAARSGLREADPGRVLVVADERWVERYQAGLRPFPIGRGFLVDPTGQGARDGGRRPLRLVPGQAFGTGEHPTTALCVEALERTVEAGTVWLDVGCGSCILSVVAAHCGAARVVGVDNDPLALEVARKVVEENGVAAVVELCEAARFAPAPRGADGAVVNISTPYLVERAGLLAGWLRPGGRLIVSGFPVADGGAVDRALAEAALAIEGREARGGWGLRLARKPEEAR